MRITALTHRFLDIDLNVAAVLLTATTVRYIHAGPSPAASQIKAGVRLDVLADSSPSPFDKRLIVAVSTNCRFCTEEAQFYRSLVLRQASDVAQSYLTGSGSKPTIFVEWTSGSWV